MEIPCGGYHLEREYAYSYAVVYGIPYSDIQLDFLYCYFYHYHQYDESQLQEVVYALEHAQQPGYVHIHYPI